MNKRKILVTGGAGYIGSVLVEELLGRGYDVRVFDNFLFGSESLDPFKSKIEIVKGDIRTIDKKVLKNIDGVIHQAGLSNDPMADFDPKANLEINALATIRLATLCKGMGIKRFTFASSASIYDKGIKNQPDLQAEDSSVDPKAAYSYSKHIAENALLEMSDDTFAPIIFRQGTVYGFSPRMRYDLVVNTMVKTALSEKRIYVFCGGVQWRPLIDVRDVAVAHIIIMDFPKEILKGQIINLLFKNYQILELAEIVKKTIKQTNGTNVEIVVDHTPKKDRSYKITNTKIKGTLYWQPEISVEQSVIHMIGAIKEYGYDDFDNIRYYNIKTLQKLKSKAL